MGFSCRSAGDINNDGFSEVVVGAHGYDATYTDEGRAYLFYGNTNGLNLSAGATLSGGQDSAAFGYAVSGAGDVNGDGFSDLVVGAFGYDDGVTDPDVFPSDLLEVVKGGPRDGRAPDEDGLEVGNGGCRPRAPDLHADRLELRGLARR